jgi:hypothetical protein
MRSDFEQFLDGCEGAARTKLAALGVAAPDSATLRGLCYQASMELMGCTPRRRAGACDWRQQGTQPGALAAQRYARESR